ncbi:unnamed protein product [Rotaria socialis]|uniref:Syndecan n=1 Tax=Rotaria socialis TaxID=392032 RepID=A0A818TIM0_9BILA|nr:unnamed protein product [Rotaria socialis]
MANDYYQYQKLCCSLCLSTVFIFLIQTPIVAIAEPNQYISTVVTKTITTTVFTVLHNNNDNIDDHGVDNNVENIYDDEEEEEDDDDEDFSIDSTSKTVSQVKFNNSITSHLNEDANANEYDDETSSYQDDEDYIHNFLHTDTMPVNRPVSKYPIIDSNNKNYFDSSSTTSITFTSSRFFRVLFSKPAILVGVIGGISIGMLSAIVLVMFIIYRMRKKDEGSYALEEAPRKSPLHAYSRVSSKEFYA